MSDDINNILVAMVDDDAQERKSLSEIGSLCQKRINQEASTTEVDRLVSYILGTEAEVNKSCSLLVCFVLHVVFTVLFVLVMCYRIIVFQ